MVSELDEGWSAAKQYSSCQPLMLQTRGGGGGGEGGGSEGGRGGKVGGGTVDMTSNMSKLFESPQFLALLASVPMHSLSASHQSPTLSEARSQSSLSGLSMLSV